MARTNGSNSLNTGRRTTSISRRSSRRGHSLRCRRLTAHSVPARIDETETEHMLPQPVYTGEPDLLNEVPIPLPHQVSAAPSLLLT